tara:strand:- start:120 stop:470 length:351 start_codon:yes stop_codon:yes gene_type:complete
MSSTTDSTNSTGFGDFTEQTIQLSSITAGALIALSHGGPTKAAPHRVSHTVVTAPTSQDPIGMSWEASSTSADTVSIRFTVPQGGDITGAVVKVYVTFKESAGGGISHPTHVVTYP